MSHSELFNAIVPYNYSTSIEDYKDIMDKYKSKTLIKFADVDNDG